MFIFCVASHYFPSTCEQEMRLTAFSWQSKAKQSKANGQTSFENVDWKSIQNKYGNSLTWHDMTWHDMTWHDMTFHFYHEIDGTQIFAWNLQPAGCLTTVCCSLHQYIPQRFSGIFMAMEIGHLYGPPNWNPAVAYCLVHAHATINNILKTNIFWYIFWVGSWLQSWQALEINLNMFWWTVEISNLIIWINMSPKRWKMTALLI